MRNVRLPHRLIFSVLLVSGVLSGIWPTPVQASLPDSDSFVVSDRLRKSVDFWINIYTQYDTHQGIVHDAKYIDHIYEVIDFSKNKRYSRQRQIREAKRHWRKVLLSVQHKADHPSLMNEEESKVFKLFADVDEPSKYLAAAHPRRLRWQLGQKSQFLEAYYISGRYLWAMEGVFRKVGLPEQLTRLPFVESSFNIKARSKVGASGIWQFMRSTGKEYMMINDAVDERNDPVLESEAAAKLLKENYEALHNWSLAVTSYNHGRKGMMRAVRRIGSDSLEDIISNYKSRSFGFASGNFYTELLAVLEVERNSKKYFGEEPPRAAAVRYYEVNVPDYIRFKDLVRFLRLDPKKLRDLNPALMPPVFAGSMRIPSGYRIRLPAKDDHDLEVGPKLFMAGYEQIPAIYKLKNDRRMRSKRRRKR